ncbi:MAG TPA: sensor domain-containing diguanylate cyclase [bacterium]
MDRTIDAKRLELLKRIDNILGSSYDPHKVIRRIYLEISKVYDTRNFYIAIYNRLENTISFEVYTIKGKHFNMLTRKLSGGMTEYVIKSKKTLRIDRNLKGFCRKHGIKIIGRLAKSWLGVPMIYKDNVEGVMNIQDYNHENAYSNMDESFLMSIASRAAVVIANTRLFEEEVIRAKELALMNQIAHRLTKSLDLATICESVTDSIIENFRNFNVAVFLLKDKALELQKLSRGFVDDVPRNLRIKPGHGIVGTILHTSRTIVSNDITRNRHYVAYGQTCTKSEIALPLKISRKLVGVLDIQCNEVNAFNQNSVRTLELIADRLSVAIHNARLYEDATNHAKELAVSFTIAQSVISTLDLDDVLIKILGVIRQTFGYTNCAILLIDKDKKELYIRAAHGYSEYVIKHSRLKIGRHEGITGYVAANSKMFYAPDVSKVPFYVQGKKTIKSEAALPLMIKGEIIGVLDLESDRLDAFSEKDLRVFSIFASQAAIAIENARLYDETKKLSLTDSLTHIANRRHFDLMLDSEMRKARGYSRPLSLAMVDLDNFKSFNDRNGHQAGDLTLVALARTLKDNVRDTDFVARYGGEEFVIIFPETSLSAALKVSERVRSAVERTKISFKNVGKGNITISIGLAAFPLNARDAVDLISNADKALYRSKSLGKNRVESL